MDWKKHHPNILGYGFVCVCRTKIKPEQCAMTGYVFLFLSIEERMYIREGFGSKIFILINQCINLSN